MITRFADRGCPVNLAGTVLMMMVIAVVGGLLGCPLLGIASPDADPAESARWQELTSEAEIQYQGDGLGLVAAGTEAWLRCVFQRLEGQVSDGGLTLVSTETAHGERFRVVARGVGRERGPSVFRLPTTGTVLVDDRIARFLRPMVVEEYSVSMEGVRQDFIVTEPPKGFGAMTLALDVSGARAEPAGDGARLVLAATAREIAYHRLHVTDAGGRTLGAGLQVISPTELVVVVDDAGAAYPVRIDPIFTDADWVSMGEAHGVNNMVSAMAVDGSGNLYVGGYFQTAGAIPASCIAKWNGSAWSALGSGVNDVVNGIAVSGSDVYVTGRFSMAGGVSANEVARWNGSAWSALGTGLSGGWATSIGVSGSNVYVGGYFTSAGGIPANYVARWNGSAWSALGTGVNDFVEALVVSGTDVYVGGRFTTAGGSPANRVARWNGSAWSALGVGTDSWVVALAVSGPNLYAGGSFGYAGGIYTGSVARWNGSAWSAMTGAPADAVHALAASGADVYAGGQFTLAGGGTANHVAKWNGTSWSALETGTDGIVYSLAAFGTTVYVGGDFGTAGNIAASRVASWNGSAWSRLGSTNFPGLTGPAWAVAVAGTNIYVGGQFRSAGDVAARNVAMWNGSTWSALGSGTDYDVRALAVSGSDLYVGGSFYTAGGVSANHIAKWNGSVWSALGTGVGALNEAVTALAVSGTDLYVGGVFSIAGGAAANNIAKWDGSAWSTLGSGVNGQVAAVAVSGTDLYVGGYFTTAGGSTANGIAKWNGASWSALGTGITSGYVYALSMFAGDLYAGGNFTFAGGTLAPYIAKWNGSTWSALGSEPNGPVYTLAANGLDLYVGGFFTNAGGSSASRIAGWDGSSWFTLGSGLNNSVFALAVHDVRLYAVGQFTSAGGKTSMYAATGYLYENFPVVVSIADVPNDQGGRVRVRFARSRLDSPYETNFPVTGYGIYHRVDDALPNGGGSTPIGAVASDRAIAGPGPSTIVVPANAVPSIAADALPPGTWEAVSWIGATQSDSYTALVPTTADSTTGGIEWSVYAITSHTTTPSTWYASPADSGYSVDNLAPNVPTGLLAGFQAGTGALLAWDDPVDADFRYFRIYRSTNPSFTPGPANLAHSTIMSAWTDPDYIEGWMFYKVTAVDFAGNESGPATTSLAVGVDGMPPPARFALHAITPNPARRQAVITYDVPGAGGLVTLRLYDVSGRSVRTLVDASRPSGQWSVTWDGRDNLGRTVAPGLYLVRMQAAGFADVRRLAMMR